MKYNHHILKIVTVLLCSLSSLFAQNGDKKNQVKVRVDLVSLGENIPGLYLGKKKDRIVNAQAFQYSMTLKYSGDSIIQISQGSSKQIEEQPMSEEDEKHALKPLTAKDLPEVETESSDKQLEIISRLRKKNPNLVALARVPAGSRHITILLRPAANNTFRTLVFNDDPTKMPYGEMKIHNFCKHPIAMKFANGKPAVIKSDKAYRLKPSKKQSVSYLLSYPKKKKWKKQESNIIRVTPDQQVRMIVLNSQSSFFQSASGARGGHLQIAILRRDRTVKPPRPGEDTPAGDKPELPNGFNKK